MNTEFGWDPYKAESNLLKHDVAFAEAATVCFDTLSITVSIGVIEYESSARAWQHPVKGRSMNQEKNNEGDPEMLDEYDFSGGVRGKYVDRFPKGSNVVVVLEPDVAQVFTD
jgi:hypothetical protein